MFHFITQENITTLIAALGLGLSLWQEYQRRKSEKEVYEISIIDYKKPTLNTIQFLIQCSNKSSFPLVITNITFCGTGCQLEPKPIRGVPGQFDFQVTPQFSLYISAHSAAQVYLEFSSRTLSHTDLYPGKAVSFEIHSTRRMEQKSLHLGNISHYLHTRAQYESQVDSTSKEPH